MAFLASDVMDGARLFLNDTAVLLYTNTVLTPHVIAANEELEQELISFGFPTERKQSTAIVVSANALTLTLPSDFLLPIRLFERISGNTSDPWVLITERAWNPESYIPGTALQYWAFYNNAINFPGATIARDVLLEYERQLAVITGPNSPEENVIFKRFLCAKTGELAARYIGMNATFADDIAKRETEPSRERIQSILTGIMQGNPVRRRRFTTRASSVIR